MSQRGTCGKISQGAYKSTGGSWWYNMRRRERALNQVCLGQSDPVKINVHIKMIQKGCDRSSPPSQYLQQQQASNI